MRKEWKTSDGHIFVVDHADNGWPKWTRVEVDGVQVMCLLPEDMRDFAYALSRCVARQDACDVDRK